MTQIQGTISNTVETSSKNEEVQSVSYDEIVSNLVSQGLPQAFNPNNYLNRIADTYSISLAEARNCLKAAIAELESQRASEKPAQKPMRMQLDIPKEEKPEEVPFQQTGYYYPNATISIKSPKNDGMDNLNSYGGYNRLMFGIK